jgi:hypothetical protein
MTLDPLYKHKIATAVCLASVCILAAVCFWHFFHQLRPDAFARIKNGMTQAEVEALVGGPPGNYGFCTNGMSSLEGVLVPGGCIEKCWWDDSHQFEVWFDSNNRVVGVHQRAYHQGIPWPI